MSTPTAGPDDRSPTARRDVRITDVSEWLANALGVESLTANEQDIADYIERLRNEVAAGRCELEESVSALRSARRDVAPIEELRDAWETYSEIATVTDGHTRACSYRYAVNSKAEPCNCGYARVERAIRLLIGNAPVSSPPILEKNDRG